MAKTADIIKQMMQILPIYSDKFNISLVIESVTALGDNLFKIKTTAAHGQKVGNWVKLQGVGVINPVTARSFSSGVYTFTTEFAHDQTEQWNKTVQLEGFSGLDDGLQDLHSVPLKNKFTIESEEDVITSNGNLIEYRIDGLNSRLEITVIDSLTEFTISAPLCPFDDFLINASTSKVFSSPRISGLATPDRIEKYYTEQCAGKWWAFVINENTSVSADRAVMSDAMQKKARADAYQAECIQNFSIYVVAPALDTIGGRYIGDEMVDIRTALCKSLCGVQFDSGFVDQKKYLTAFLGDGFYDYVGAYYVHKFTFETVYDMSAGDIVEPSDTRAFRRFEVGVKLQFDEYTEVKKQIDGDLP